MASATVATATTTILVTATATSSNSVSATASIISPTTTITEASTPEYLLGPLTTQFTAPIQCSQAYWLSNSAQYHDPYLGQTCASVDGQITYIQDNNCLPPVTKSEIIASLVGASSVLSTSYDYIGYYSPGISCPAGYATACAAQAGSNGVQSTLSGFESFGFVHTPSAYETAMGCCPTASSSSTLLPLPTIFTASTTLRSTVITEMFNFTTLSMIATMVQLKFQATDLPSASSSSSSSSSSLSTATGTSSGSQNHKTTTIAVAVVIPCVAVLIAAGLAWLWYRRRAKKRYQAAQSTEPSNPYYRASNVPTEIAGDSSRFEMDGTIAHEMAGTEPKKAPHEMYAGDEIPRYRDDGSNDDPKEAAHDNVHRTEISA
ncbi:hypothetical protein UA08_02488 [Talaromyces atroroseus]|uniref:Uncharacterized protein n=1 Tax=Talaromyces atroroseus TaxID=1441469 RepID=A0A225B4N7_TALAT|nr:hypothetical protein UA08_02488 [Talaromyces atroroseus]OKL61825.1 hypothetical protein UA08_02488 [Talaromyces atroroseus]